MQVLVTGGTGVIGRYVVQDLLQAGHQVTNIGRSTGAQLPCRHLRADLTNAGDVYEALAMSKAEAVVHMGAWSNWGIVPHTRTYGDNVQGTFNLFQACVDLDVKRIISASSAQVYGLERFPPVYVPVDEEHPLRPLNSYALAKIANERAAEYFVANYGLTILSFRIMATRAPAKIASEVAHLSKHPETGTFLLWTRGDARDCARACRLAIEKEDVASGVYNITGGVVLSETSEQLVRRYFGDRTEMRASLKDHESPLSCAKAEATFGYRPTYLWSETRAYPEEQ
jgi:nucleoside-diphosphate-sugar epimerase